MRAGDAFPSKYLKVDDLKGRKATVTIKACEMRHGLGDREDESKPVLMFEGTERELILNKTNFNTIVDVTGEADTDDWTGATIALYEAKTEYQGKRVPCIRIHPDCPAWPNGKPSRSVGDFGSVSEMARAEQGADEEETAPF